MRWDPAGAPPAPDGRLDPPPVRCTRDRFDAEAVRALAAGRPADCFGPEWEITRAHVRTSRIGAGRLLRLGAVTSFDPDGGPWGRGYLRAETPVSADDWFFAAHLPDDPCMPANLMFDGGLQAMEFYLVAAGFTMSRDGWRFEPLPDRPCRWSCRSQVTPHSRMLSYEVFVRECAAGDEPTLTADVLCTVDGVTAMHADGIGLRLVRDWPLRHWRQLGPAAVQPTGESVPLSRLGGLRGFRDDNPVAEFMGVRGDYSAVLASAWGDPLSMLPAPLADTLRGRRAGRLPGPPYLFVTRIADVAGTPGEERIGSCLEAEYDIPERSWFFDQNGCPVMPFAALMEVLLQPCGVLSGFAGGPLHATGDLHYRNLDGTGVFTAQVPAGTRRLRTRVELRSSFRIGEATIHTFDVSCRTGDGTAVFTGSATFGFFPTWAFDHQPGLPPAEAERARLGEPCEFLVDLRRRPARYCGRSLRLAGPMLLMLDRVTGFWPGGGMAGLGRLRAELDVDADAWYFKAHFFEDPVQPGSLGNEAILQLLQFFLIETGAAAGMEHPVFEAVMLDAPVTWKYRGQVVPTDELVTVEVGILAVDERSVRAEGWLWVDGRRIYHVAEIGMRVTRGKPAEGSSAEADRVLDPVVDTWLGDHRPMWAVPSLPMMSTADLLAGAAADYLGAEITGLRDLRLLRWLPVPDEVRLRTRVERVGNELRVGLLVWTPAESRFVPVASALAGFDPPGERPQPFEPLPDLVPELLPYDTAEMFHGPAFQYLTSWWLGATGASGVLDIGRGLVPRGYLRPGLLDAMTHVIPHRRLGRWSSRVEPGRIAFPSRLAMLRVFEPLPENGELRVEARFAGFEANSPVFPIFDLQLCRDGRVLVALRLIETVVPLGRYGQLTPRQQRAFCGDREYVDGIGLSTTRNGSTVIEETDIDYVELIPGSVAAVYRLPAGVTGSDRLARVAIADHVARTERVHPSRIEISEDLHTAHVTARSDHPHHLDVTHAPGQVTVRPRCE
jgi:3-hydroxymyristoyl/3-hydroxydecanoyl-(acyl carrier protein) dehydratase